ncbi:MAG: GGDEF domain-containing protein, partial [Thermoleophilia bacterium]|nr:GGDEF domain-containing protein [Thermoleophilia bacterium]
MIRRSVVAGGFALVAYVVAYHVACQLLPADSYARALVSDLGFVAFEVGAVVLCFAAWRSNRERRDQWVWAGVGVWLLLNLFADSVWGYYEVVAKVEVPFPGLADVGYLGSYVVAFVTVIIAAWKASGRLRAIETTLDAMMFTIGVAAVLWPFLLGPLVREPETDLGFWVNLAYPIADLLIVLAFATFFLATSAQERRRPPTYFVVICVAFLCQAVGDSAYFVVVEQGGDYGPGSWMDTVWLLAFAIAGIAALMAIRSAKEPAIAGAGETEASAQMVLYRDVFSGRWRILIPYVVLVALLVVLMTRLAVNDWQWSRQSWGPFILGLATTALLVVRQYAVLAQNRRLGASLAQTSGELEVKVADLEGLNARLEMLNDRSNRINTLRDLHEVAEAGLELACLFAGCPGGWLTIKDEQGQDAVIATRGQVEQHHPGTATLNAAAAARGSLRAVPLEVRGEGLGTIWLVRPANEQQGPDLLPVIATHVATSLDNAKRYEEAVHLAERDPLTGLFNHRGIHRRLAGEALRAQQSGSELSLVMMDLDDFKMLNDTYGHPAGDAVLKQVSDAVRSVLRHADLAGRVGGDELLLVLPNTGAEGAMQLCERLRGAQLIRPFVAPDGQNVPVSFSLGVATYPDDAQSLGQLIEIADANLYASKQRGGNATTGSPPQVAESRAVDAAGVLGVAGRLLNVVGARDHYTRRHSEHVALFALSLGEAAGLSEESLDTLHVA